MKPRYRPMVETDAMDCSEIEQRCCDCDQPWTDRMVKAQIQRKDTQGLVATRDGEIMGFVLYRFEPVGITVFRLAVDPWHQRVRVATGLLNRIRLKCGLVTVPGGPGKVSMLVRETDDSLIRFASHSEGIASLVRSPFPGEDIDGYRFVFDPIYANVTSREA